MICGGAEAVMLVLGSGCEYRSSLAERCEYTETTTNQLLVDSYQNPISEWQVTSKLHLLAGYKAILSPHPLSVKKLSYMKLVPGAKKVGEHCSRGKEVCTLLA